MYKILTKKGDAEFIVSDKDYPWVSKKKWKVGGSRDYNLYIKEAGFTSEYISRQIMGAKKGEMVDHINGNTLDNRRSNLRICTPLENSRNRATPKNNTTGFKGVTYLKNKKYFVATVVISKHGFKTAKEAAVYYNILAKKIYGKYARFNEV